MEYRSSNLEDLGNLKGRLKEDMLKAADALEFERAAVLRDQLMDIENKIRVLKKVKGNE